ncbi:MAG: ribosome assembly factor SBDS [Candidatus Lokiarchaeota archaeon]|nr:ribosome assembly factor SBDS [Candidatus Lokiarchaeota archaeon]
MSGIRGDKRIDIGDNIIAEYEQDGYTFEIIVHPEKSWAYREGKNVDITDVLEGYIIFEDARRGRKAMKDDLEYVFGTDEVFKIADQILKHGTIQLTTERRKKLVEEKKEDIIKYIVKNSIDPTKNTPHPPARIERAMEEANVQIDPWEDTKSQAEKIVSELTAIIPIRLEVLKIALKIPSKFASKSYSIVEKYGTIEKDEWQKDGSWIVVLEIPAGLQQKLLDELKSLTKGKFDLKRM